MFAKQRLRHVCFLLMAPCSLIAQSSSYSEEQLEAGALQISTSIKHKYAGEVPVRIQVTMGGECRTLSPSLALQVQADCHQNLSWHPFSSQQNAAMSQAYTPAQPTSTSTLLCC